MIGYIVIGGSASLLLPLTGPGWRLAFLVVGEMVMMAFIVAFNIVQVSYRQTICPDHLLGRMNATMRFVMWGTTPLGGLLGGVLGTAVGLRNTLWITGVGTLLPVLWLVFSPLGPAALRGEELEQPGVLGQGAGGDEPQHVGAGAGPVDGVRLGQGVPAAVEQGEHGAGVPGRVRRRRRRGRRCAGSRGSRRLCWSTAAIRPGLRRAATRPSTPTLAMSWSRTAWAVSTRAE
jgi:hypothetical protein